MKEFRDRVLIPLAIPLVAMGVIGVVVLNLSRILLALEERGSPTLATTVAIVMASAVLFGCAWISARGEERRSGGNIGTLVVSGLVLLTAGAVGAEAIQEEHEKHAAEENGQLGEPDLVVTAGPGLIFQETDVSASTSDGLAIEYVNVDAIAHTFLFDGAAPGFKLTVNAEGDTDSGRAELTPGTYTFYCDIPGHRQAGMEGTLTVNEGGAGEGGAEGTGEGGAEGTGEGGAEGAAGGGSGGGTVAVDAGPGLVFSPSELTAPAGQVTIEFTNADPLPHTLLFDGAAPGLKLSVSAEGDTDSGEAELTPGTYTFYCDVPGHRQAGMEGTFTAT